MAIPRYATVALALPFKFHSGGTDGLTYEIPEHLATAAQVGCRVLVPLGRNELTGVLVSLSHLRPDAEVKLRPISDVLDTEPIFDTEFLAWTKWLAEYYMSSWGDVLQTALPNGLKPETTARVFLGGDDGVRPTTGPTNSKRRLQVLEVLQQHGERSIAQIQKAIGTLSVYAPIHQLEQEGLVRVERNLVRNAKAKTERIARLPESLAAGSEALSLTLTSLERSAPRQANILLTLIQYLQTSDDDAMPLALLLERASASPSTFEALREKGLIALDRRVVKTRTSEYHESVSESDLAQLTFSEEQRFAIHTISSHLETREHRTILLHGVTGSGKTEIYAALARETLRTGGGVLILVPEIALTPQLIDRFRARLSLERHEDIAVLHSKRSIGERAAAWRSLAEGTARIAIGARSAVFAPVKNLRLIVVDEEHETTYKQYDSTPRYHARDAAVVRAAMLKCVAVLGSATPSIESAFNAKEGKYELIELKERIGRAALPVVRIIDQRTAKNRPGFDRERRTLTPELQEAIASRLAKKEGVVLLQNRRGFSTYLQCLSCGEYEMCPNCSVTTTYHRAVDQMRCHYCGFFSRRRTTCAYCGSEELKLGGIGTERVEDDLRIAFPDVRVARMDLDTTSRKGAYQKILTSFANREADILLGTQMVAKGLDFPHVTLVGVISADVSLLHSDFRSSERTFQLLSQVAGRAGRSRELPGEVLIQTLQPEHRAIVLAAKHDYRTFFERELHDRALLDYPPYSRLILIEFRGLHERVVEERARAFASLFPERGSFFERIGPSVPQLVKLRNEYRWHVIIKDIKRSDPSGEKIRKLLTGAVDRYQREFASQHVKVTVDVDAQTVA